MSAVNYENVRRAFRKVLDTAGSACLPTRENRAWENKTFSPPKDKAWMRETMFPVSEEQRTNSIIEVVALLQYDVFVPVNAGTEKLGEITKAIQDAFPPASSVLDRSTGVECVVDRCEPKTPIKDSETWWMRPVVIRARWYWSKLR